MGNVVTSNDRAIDTLRVHMKNLSDSMKSAEILHRTLLEKKREEERERNFQQTLDKNK